MDVRSIQGYIPASETPRQHLRRSSRNYMHLANDTIPEELLIKPIDHTKGEEDSFKPSNAVGMSLSEENEGGFTLSDDDKSRPNEEGNPSSLTTTSNQISTDQSDVNHSAATQPRSWCVIGNDSMWPGVKSWGWQKNVAHFAEALLPCWSWFAQTNSTFNCGIYVMDKLQQPHP